MGRWDNKKPSDYIKWDIVGDEGLDEHDKKLFECAKEVLKGIVDGEDGDESWNRLEPIYGAKMLYVALEIVGATVERMAKRAGINTDDKPKDMKEWLGSGDFKSIDFSDEDKEKWK